VVDVRLSVVPRSLEFTVEAVLVRQGGHHDEYVYPHECDAPVHLRATALTAPDPAIRDLAGDLRREAGDDLDLA